MRSFLDTNVLVYVFDHDAPDKQRTARELLRSETLAGRAVISTQVLQELYVASTRKLNRPLSPEVAEGVVRDLSALPVVQVDSAMVLSAITRSRTALLSFWDALIVESALVGGAARLYTEDLQHRQRFDALEVVNPFV